MTIDRSSEKSRNQTQSRWRRDIDPLGPVWREERVGGPLRNNKEMGFLGGQA